MRVPVAEPRTRPSRQGLAYFEATPVDSRGLQRGLGNLAASVEDYGRRQEEAENKVSRFDALRKFSDFQTSTALELNELQKTYDPTDDQFPRKVQELYDKRETDFLGQIKPELQDEFSYRTNEYRNGIVQNTEQFIQKSRLDFFAKGVDQEANNLKTQFAQDPNDDNLVVAVTQFEDLVDSADVPEQVKAEWKAQGTKDLKAISYRAKKAAGLTTQIMANGQPGDAQNAVTAAANELGIDPIDLATVISYETAGKFSTSIKGGKGGAYLGLIQFGPEEARKYGVRPGQSVPEQMKAVVAYLKDRGFKPGMSLTDLYSTINAGTPGRRAASDGNNTIVGHVEEMTASHRKNAEAFMKGKIQPDALDTDPMYDELSYEDKVKLTADAAGEANRAYAAAEKAAKEQEEAFNNNLYIQLYEGRAGQKEIDEAVQAGYLSDYDNRKKANDIYREVNEKAINASNFASKLSGEMFFDPTSTEDNKQFNAWVGDEGLKSLNNMDQEYVNNVLGPTIRKVHAIPSSVVGGLEGMARSRDPKKQGFALNTLAQFEDWEPAAFEKLSSQTQSDVNLWRRWKDVLPQDELFREINGGIDSAQRQAKRAYREEADKVLSDPKNPNFTSMESLVDEFDGWFSASPETPNIWFAARGVMNDYQETFRNEYVRNNGNVEAAKASALKQVKSRWSVSSIGGQSTLTRNAPEKYYPTFLGEHKWMEDQARLDNGFAPTDKFQLIADDNTQKEVDAGQSPSYLMVKQGPDGVWREVTNKDGKLVRQYFEMPAGLKEIDILDQKIDALRYDLTHFNLGEDNVLDASDERRAELREQRKIKQLRLQELEAEFNARHKPEALSESALGIITKGSAFDIITEGSAFDQLTSGTRNANP